MSYTFPTRFDGADKRQFAGNVVNDVIYPQVNIAFADSPMIDAFGRMRVSEPTTIFDSKQVFDKQPLFWDDQETSGGGTGSAHSTAEAATTISVSATTAGTRVRQTFRRFNYQPGKSHLVLVTFGEFKPRSGITKRVGYFDENNGLFFESSEGTWNVVRRTKVDGTATDNLVAQNDWNIDPMDGTGPSGKTLDYEMTQIGFIDIEWLGVGRVRLGWVVDGAICYCHEFLNANNLETVYMSTPNLPLRYEIANDGTGQADTFMTICSSVISEGGIENTGILRSASTANTQVDANAADTLYAVIGMRLKSAYIGTTVELERLSMLAETNDDFEWGVYWNPTVDGTFTYSDQTNSAVQIAKGATANTASGGYLLDGGYASADFPLSASLQNALILGSSISGTVDSIVLCVRPIGSNSDIQATLTWRELL